MEKPEAPRVADAIRRGVLAAGGRVYRIHPREMLPGLTDIPVIAGETAVSRCQIIAVLGGDGTLLSAARRLAPLGIPVMGINLGRRGFLASAEAEELDAILAAIAEDGFALDERMMLEASLEDGRSRQLALNDLGVFNGVRGRMIRLLVRIDGEVLDEYYADGVLVSSPTGSTAYSLSAGGPLIAPRMSCMLITPICAHSLRARPVVVGADSRISIEPGARFSEAELTADGQERTPLRPGQAVVIGKAPCGVRLARVRKQGFYEVVRQKISEWGSADLRNGGSV